MSIVGIIAAFGAGYILRDNMKHTNYHKINDPNSIKTYAKNLFLDKMDILFYGGTGNRNAAILGKLNTPPKYNYSGYVGSPQVNYLSTPKVDNIIFDTSNDAKRVLARMRKEIKDKGEVTIYDYYRFSGYEISSDHRDYIYGWKNLYNGQVYERADCEWVIDLPKPVCLED